MSDTAAASQPWCRSLNRTHRNFRRAANLGWLPRDMEQRYFAGRPDELQPGSLCLSHTAHFRVSG